MSDEGVHMTLKAVTVPQSLLNVVSEWSGCHDIELVRHVVSKVEPCGCHYDSEGTFDDACPEWQETAVIRSAKRQRLFEEQMAKDAAERRKKMEELVQDPRLLP